MTSASSTAAARTYSPRPVAPSVRPSTTEVAPASASETIWAAVANPVPVLRERRGVAGSRAGSAIGVDRTRGHAGHDGAGRHRPRDHRAGPHDGLSADVAAR